VVYSLLRRYVQHLLLPVHVTADMTDCCASTPVTAAISRGKQPTSRLRQGKKRQHHQRQRTPSRDPWPLPCYTPGPAPERYQ
jgi:hypothetical protein